MFDLSVVIVSYNSAHLLPRCLRSLHEAVGSLLVETIVVDNGSRDGSAELLRKELKPTKLIEAGENLGFSRANNLGARCARGRYYLLLNSDCFVRPGLPQRLIAALEADTSAGAVGPRLLNSDGTLQPSCHNFPNPLVFFLEQSLLWKLLRYVPFLKDKLSISSGYTSPAEVDWMAGACLLVRREAFAEVGGFDERFFFYWEETDLCMQLRKHGWKRLFEPSATAVHLGGGSSLSPELRVQFFRSLYRFYRKHCRVYNLMLVRGIVRLMALYKAARSWLATLYPVYAADVRASCLQDAIGWLKVARL